MSLPAGFKIQTINADKTYSSNKITKLKKVVVTKEIILKNIELM